MFTQILDTEKWLKKLKAIAKNGIIFNIYVGS